MPGAGGCQEVAGLLQAQAEGGISAGDRALLEPHLASCPSCSREAARLKDNGEYLREVLGPRRMPQDFPSDFLFRLPPRDAKRRAAAPAEPAAPRTVVMGDTRPRRAGPWLWIGGLAFLGAVGFTGWFFLRPPPETYQHDRSRTLPTDVKRDPKGQGGADPRTVGGGSPGAAPGQGTGGRPPVTAPDAPVRDAAGLAAAVRGVRAESWGPAILRGWDFLAGSPAEIPKVRAEAEKEKDPKVRAALVLCLGASADEECRNALRSFLADEAPEVRGAAALALGRSLSFDAPAKRAVPAGPPLNVAVQVGALADEPARAEVLGRLSQETDGPVRRTLLLVLSPTAAGDPAVREKVLEGVKGAYGDENREVCVKALQGVQDPALVPVFAEALAAPGTPKALHGEILDAMIGADRNAAAESIAGLLPSAEGVELRRELVQACAKAGGPAAEKALLQVLSGDAEAQVRLAAVQALLRFPSREAADAAQQAADADADQLVRQEAEKVARVLKTALEKPEEK